MPDDTQIVSIEKNRLLRLKKAVMLASAGAFGDAMGLLDDLPRDDFADVEQVVRSIIFEYRIAVEHSEVSIEEFAASKRELLQKIDMIHMQKEAIQKLSAPIIDVWDDIITVPLTGVIDSARAAEISERLLARIQDRRTAWVLLDVTGIELADPRNAGHLVKLASATRLMGAECLLTGIRADVAQALVAVGMSLEGLRPIATLKDGLKYCLARSSSRRFGM